VLDFTGFLFYFILFYFILFYFIFKSGISKRQRDNAGKVDGGGGCGGVRTPDIRVCGRQEDHRNKQQTKKTKGQRH
jgi:hypothetical protein